LEDIGEQNWDFAHRLFQCVAAAARPLRVEELAEFLAFDFEGGPTPTLLADWRPEDPSHAVLSTCSSLLAIVNVDGSSVIQFAHFSVKEYLTSERLANADDSRMSRFHVSMTPAHTIVAQACLGTLLHLDKNTTKASLEKFPLADYAAEHWVGHARLENVSLRTKDAVKCLFEPTEHHLSVWVWIYDPENRQHRSEQGEFSSQRQTRATPLHYAAACGIHDIARFLIVERSQDVNARGFDGDETPLAVACRFGYFEVVQVLLEHGANTETRALKGGDWSPLERALQVGHVKIVQVLLGRGADPEVRDGQSMTPLHHASFYGQLGVVHVLLEHGVDMNAKDVRNATPLHDALEQGHVGTAQLLLEGGADPGARNKDNSTPLHHASRWGHLEIVQILLEHGTDANAQDSRNRTPLWLASEEGHLGIVRLLQQHNSDIHVRDEDGHTPFQRASARGHHDVIQLLLEHGAEDDTVSK
jgi:ankyrin repeat protein